MSGHTCPKCDSAIPKVVALASDGVLLRCSACEHLWTLATVPEPYLRGMVEAL